MLLENKWDKIYLWLIIYLMGIGVSYKAKEMKRKCEWEMSNDVERRELERKEEKRAKEMLEYAQKRSWWKSFFLELTIIVALIFIIWIKCQG